MKRLTQISMRLFGIATIALAAASAACTSGGGGFGCGNDNDCDVGFFCQVDTGTCRCRTDDACGAGLFCNSFGSCQDRPPCIGNQDCEMGFICNSSDPSGGVCIPEGQCGDDVHCDIGEFCPPPPVNDPTLPRSCEVGCRVSGDCPLGDVCVAGTCTDAGNASGCTTCPVAPDPDASYCDYGDFCDFSTGNCTPHAQKANACLSCTADPNICPAGTKCVADNEAMDEFYCAPVCDFDIECPNGFSGCGSLDRVVGFCNPQTTATCANGGACIPTTESSVGFCECLADSDCTPYSFSGSPPLVFTSPADFAGSCNSLQCQFSACLIDSDCPGSTCNLTTNQCTGSRPCVNDDDCVCFQGSCWLTGDPCSTAADCFPECNENGICPTKFQVCGKESGVTCDTIINGEALCRSI